MQITKKKKVERIEYLTEPPSFWPIRAGLHQTAFVLDLRSGGPNSEYRDADGNLRTMDALIKNIAFLQSEEPFHVYISEAVITLLILRGRKRVNLEAYLRIQCRES